VVIAFVAIVTLIGVGVVAWFAKTGLSRVQAERADHPAPSSMASGPATVVVPSASIGPSAVTPPTGASDIASGAASAPSAPSAESSAAKPPPAAPSKKRPEAAPTPHPHTGPSAPADTGLDIRMQR
jgi:hypothetical protein